MKVLAESLGAAAAIVIALVAGTVGSVEDERVLLPAVALPLIAMVAGMVWTVVASREQPFVAVEQASQRPRAETRPRPRDFAWYLASRFAGVAAVSFFVPYGLYYLRDVAKQPDPVAALGVVGLAAGAMLSIAVVVAGKLSDRVGPRRLVLVGSVGSAIGVVALLPLHELVLIVVVAGCIGAAAGVLLASNWALALDIVSSSWPARQLGIVNIVTAGGAAMARLSGVGIDALNRQSDGLGYTVALSAVAGLLFVAGFAITRVRGVG